MGIRSKLIAVRIRWPGSLVYDTCSHGVHFVYMIQSDVRTIRMQCTQYTSIRPRLTSLVLASLPDLRLETGLDSVDGTPRAARLARHEEYTVLLREERVW